MYKKILSIFLALFLLLLVSNTSQAAGNAKVIFSPQSNLTNGKSSKIDVFIDSNVVVNAAQLKILFPATDFILNSIDSSNSKFTIMAEEDHSPGTATVARGNVKALKGKVLFTTLIVTPQKPNTSVGSFTYDKTDSLVMSKDNVNVLTNSQVMTQKPVTTSNSGKKGFVDYVKIVASEFFKGLLGRK